MQFIIRQTGFRLFGNQQRVVLLIAGIQDVLQHMDIIYIDTIFIVDMRGSSFKPAMLVKSGLLRLPEGTRRIGG